VVGEVFSWVTARYVFSSDRVINRRELTSSFSQKEIMEAQCDLLVSSFKDHKTIALVKENIRHISSGSSSHRAGALQLGLEKAFELKKKGREPAYRCRKCRDRGCWTCN
jgi:hypothetical protein